MSLSKKTYAAIDLGSNSFHMLVARYDQDKVVIIDRMKEMVRLAGGLGRDNKLSDKAIADGISCLEKFGQRLADIPNSNVRIVGTNTLRKARNSKDFIRQARTALGKPVEVISGREEARLIYVGVANTIFDQQHKRLVLDIGGGSTELIIGRGHQAILTESLYMGCVNTTHQYFADGVINTKRMRRAVLFARQELEAVELLYKLESWDLAYGTSGTVRSIQEIITGLGWAKDTISYEALKRLQQHLIDIGHIDKLDFTELNTRRLPVFAGGVAILTGLFEALELKELHICHGALREGLLYDLLGRSQDKDIRDETVKAMASQYTLDTGHTAQVRDTAAVLFKQVAKNWNLSKSDKKILHWSAELHTIGLRVAHSQYHKHGAYLITHSDLSGFSRQEQSNVACLIRFHRRKFNLEELKLMLTGDEETIIRLCCILRLSVVLHRSRSPNPLPEIQITAEEKKISLTFPKEWLASHPLTETDLETEQSYVETIGYQLLFQ